MWYHKLFSIGRYDVFLYSDFYPYRYNPPCYFIHPHMSSVHVGFFTITKRFTKQEMLAMPVSKLVKGD